MTTLREYYDELTPAEKKAFAEACGTSVQYLSQLATGHRRPSPKMARTLHEQSAQRIPLASLRPDLWAATPSGGE